MTPRSRNDKAIQEYINNQELKVTPEGTITNHKDRPYTLSESQFGYLRLRFKNRWYQASRVVAIATSGVQDLNVTFLDNNPKNLHPSNLQYTTHQGCCKGRFSRHPGKPKPNQSRLDETTIEAILKEKRENPERSNNEIAEMYGLSPKHVGWILKTQGKREPRKARTPIPELNNMGWFQLARALGLEPSLISYARRRGEYPMARLIAYINRFTPKLITPDLVQELHKQPHPQPPISST